MTIVFASANENKIAEIRSLLPENFEILSLSDIGCFEEIPETAQTIEGNAILKANFLTGKYNLNCFADDTGLEVESLDGAPGVYSARYAGPQKDADDNIQKLLAELKGTANRRARFVTVIALSLNGTQHLFTGIAKGVITEAPRGNFGFGYDPVFVPDGESRTFAEMTMSEKAAFSHRAAAVRQLVDFLHTLNS